MVKPLVMNTFRSGISSYDYDSGAKWMHLSKGVRKIYLGKGYRIMFQMDEYLHIGH
jgi:hypothetical protein